MGDKEPRVFTNPSRPWAPDERWEQLVASMRELRFHAQDAACKLSYLNKEMDRVLTTQELLAMARRGPAWKS